jgi:uncharacterized membrane protein YeaQ/YmgE (transglycosylase-associated protein family)
MKIISIAFAILGAAICAFVVRHELASTQPRLIELGNLLVLTMTLVVLVWYAYDTNSIARVTRDRWTREGILATTYSLGMLGASVGDSGHTTFQLHNGSPLVVRAKVNFNFKVYGHPVVAGALYEGKENWLLFPHQQSQGWFEVESLLKQQGKNVAAMQAEVSEENRKRQLTMVLELTFWDELGATRALPPRPHYFDFKRWAWIPSLGEHAHA